MSIAARRDIRGESLYREAEVLYRLLRQPGTGQISDAAELYASPHGDYVAFTGTIVQTLEGKPSTRICVTDLGSGDTRIVTHGPNLDRSPKVSPDARTIAFLSDRHSAGDFQLHLLSMATGAARAAPRVEGWVEYLHWSPNGKLILLGVAGHGADVSGAQGAVTSKRATTQASWMPSVETGDEDYRWRSAWIYDLAADQVRCVSRSQLNIWEATWSGNDSIATVVSPGPGEGLWYGASLHLVEVATGKSHEVYAPRDQLGSPAASPSGRHLAVVEAVCSDRGSVAGDLRLIECGSRKVRRVDTRQIDVTYTEWRSERDLLIAGHRGPETVVALYDASVRKTTEVWSSRVVSTAGFYAAVSGFDRRGNCALVGESFVRAPEIAVIRDGKYRIVKSFELGFGDHLEAIGAAKPVSWKASDGLEIQGWLVRPRGHGPHPLIMSLHGGPIFHNRPGWMGRRLGALMLIKRGYAFFNPNPRGSSGRGQEFARMVVGDMGGADADDCLAGLDHLVRRRVADSNRLGVTGGSYGGFMTSWLITKDPRFAAAVSVAPVTNHVTEHLVGNIPHFVAKFSGDTYRNAEGRYFTRSPIMHAHKVQTPTLNVCGALDRCTPPGEAVQFHHALREHGVESVLLTYPLEGHAVRSLPAAIDYAARFVGWFEDHMSLKI